MDLLKLRDYNIERAAVKLLIELNYSYMDGEIGYDNIDDLFVILEEDDVDWNYYKKLTGHDFYNEFVTNKTKYNAILEYVCHIQMVDCNRISWGVRNGYRRWCV